jgi:hypothetical protein
MQNPASGYIGVMAYTVISHISGRDFTPKPE